MHLYLVQHALSKNREEDPERGITDEGRIETAKTGIALSGLKPEIKSIWHSRKKRAFETAEIFADQLGIHEDLVEKDNLNPTDPVEPVLMELNQLNENTIVVGHLPYLSNLLSCLLDVKKDREIFQFRNSGIICLEKVEKSWKLLWAVTPEILS